MASSRALRIARIDSAGVGEAGVSRAAVRLARMMPVSNGPCAGARGADPCSSARPRATRRLILLACNLNSVAERYSLRASTPAMPRTFALAAGVSGTGEAVCLVPSVTSATRTAGTASSGGGAMRSWSQQPHPMLRNGSSPFPGRFERRLRDWAQVRNAPQNVARTSLASAWLPSQGQPIAMAA